MAMKPDTAFYNHVARELIQGRLTPFLGAGVNLATTSVEPFVPGLRLPTGTELAELLAHEFSYSGPAADDLVRVSQWVAVRLGPLTLYEYLHSVFNHDYPPTPVHEVLARMPAYIRQQHGLEHPLMITTNYDDALERAFQAEGEEYDLLTYLATGRNRGKFRHTAPDGSSRVVEVPNRYKGVTLLERPAITKIHGAVMRGVVEPDDDSYVVTEDDYIDCLTRTDIVQLLPPGVVQRMQRCHYLFLGYSLRDWNLRAILHRIRRDRSLANESWAIAPSPDPMEEKAWKNRNVEMFESGLEDFARVLDSRITATVQKLEA